jgi:hypothetical protein
VRVRIKHRLRVNQPAPTPKEAPASSANETNGLSRATLAPVRGEKEISE